MRNLKKLAAVGLTAAMTMAMSVVSFAATDVTLHFKNAAGWDRVGGWIYEGVGFTTQIMPQDKCPAYNTGTNRAIWPGAELTKEADYDGWYSITVTVNDTSQGMIAIFNNMVADTAVDTASGGNASDQQFVDASGLTKDSNAKKQTPNQMVVAREFTGTEYWCDFDGNTAGQAAKMLSSAPASYVKTSTSAPAETQAAGSTTETTKASTTSTTSVKTGDSAAYAIVFTGIAAAAVFVASRRKVNE